MAINLSSYTNIQSHLFVKITVDEYRTTSTGSYTSEVLTYSDYGSNYTLEGREYIGLGYLMSVTASSSQLRVSANDVTLTISGIPTGTIGGVLHSKIKGSSVEIKRVLFNATTGAYLNISGNPIGRFIGYINNFSINEDWDNTSRTSTNTVIFNCNTKIDMLQNKIAGRRTNPDSEKSFFASDVSFDRVPNLANAAFDFGAPK